MLLIIFYCDGIFGCYNTVGELRRRLVLAGAGESVGRWGRRGERGKGEKRWAQLLG
jgi:hypothetical protein